MAASRLPCAAASAANGRRHHVENITNITWTARARTAVYDDVLWEGHTSRSVRPGNCPSELNAGPDRKLHVGPPDAGPTGPPGPSRRQVGPSRRRVGQVHGQHGASGRQPRDRNERGRAGRAGAAHLRARAPQRAAASLSHFFAARPAHRGAYATRRPARRDQLNALRGGAWAHANGVRKAPARRHRAAHGQRARTTAFSQGLRSSRLATGGGGRWKEGDNRHVIISPTT